MAESDVNTDAGRLRSLLNGFIFLNEPLHRHAHNWSVGLGGGGGGVITTQPQFKMRLHYIFKPSPIILFLHVNEQESHWINNVNNAYKNKSSRADAARIPKGGGEWGGGGGSIPACCSRMKLESWPLLAISGRVSRLETLSASWRGLHPYYQALDCDTSRMQGKNKQIKTKPIPRWTNMTPDLRLGWTSGVCSPGVYLVTEWLECKPLLLCSAWILWMNQDCTIRGRGGRHESLTFFSKEKKKAHK